MISIATTTIRVERQSNLASDPQTVVDPYGDGYDTVTDDPVTWVTIDSDVRATISNPSGREVADGGSEETVTYVLNCDPTDVRHYDRVIDETTGAVYQVSWSVLRAGLGLDHVHAGLQTVEGVA